MMFYDFIEIGTSDFDTEIQKDDGKVGISIEPIKYYLDRLPNKPNCIKLNIAISNYNGTCVVNYLSDKTIQQYNFPTWVGGCNSINSYHTTVSNLCIENGINIESIISKELINVLTLYQLIHIISIDGFYFLKIDTEGHDTVILKKFIEDNNDNMYLPHVIQFESNVLSKKEDVDELIELLVNNGYDLIESNHDTVLHLNLQKLKNKTKFTSSIKKYYIMDYPQNYSLTDLPHENTLEDAKQYCITHNYSGVTFQDGIYQVRNGYYINYTNEDVLSWIYI